jgi:hypothetical protein
MTAPHNKTAAALAPDLLDPGAAIAVCVQPGVSEFHVQAAIEQMLCGLRSWAGFECTSVQSVTSIPRTLSASKLYQRAAPALLAPDCSFKLLSSTTTSGVDLLSREGRTLALADLGDSPGVVTANLGILDKNLVKRAHGLQELLAALAQRSTATVLLFAGEPTDQSAAITLNFDNVLIVKEAEADPDMNQAYSVEWTTQSVLACSDKQPHLEQYSIGAGRTQSDVFVAKDYLSRRIYAMRQRGATLDQIGRKLELDKSNVSRRLASLPPVESKPRKTDDFEA